MRCAATSIRATNSSRVCTVRGPPLGEDRKASLHAARTRLARGKFVLAVVGEFSSGKSFLLNALLGIPLRGPGSSRLLACCDDINPSTATITELEHGAGDEATAFYEDGRTERVPLDRSAVSPSAATPAHCTTRPPTNATRRCACIVKTDSPFLQRGFVVADTPGLASINPAHRRATLQFLPDADAVLYLIDTQQPFTEGDASFLGHHPPAHRLDLHRANEDRFVASSRKVTDAPRGSTPTSGSRAWPPCTRPAPTSTRFPHASMSKAPSTATRRPSNAAAFRQFLNALDASLVKRTGRARLRRAGDTAAVAANDEIDPLTGIWRCSSSTRRR